MNPNWLWISNGGDKIAGVVGYGREDLCGECTVFPLLLPSLPFGFIFDKSRTKLILNAV